MSMSIVNSPITRPVSRTALVLASVTRKVLLRSNRTPMVVLGDGCVHECRRREPSNQCGHQLLPQHRSPRVARRKPECSITGAALEREESRPGSPGRSASSRRPLPLSRKQRSVRPPLQSRGEAEENASGLDGPTIHTWAARRCHSSSVSSVVRRLTHKLSWSHGDLWTCDRSGFSACGTVQAPTTGFHPPRCLQVRCGGREGSSTQRSNSAELR